ncbi:MAG: hypothetical protein OIF50_10620 [Flavobacteriaceae bacterium]|nr:hypothetical protein [Flavobacteriaceae bacterium]
MLDYAYNENSKGAYSPKGSLVSSNASWVEILEGNITLGAKETRNIPYTIKVPNSLQKGGSRWSVLMIEPISHENTPQKNNFSISSVVRYAVLMVTDIAMEKNTQSIIHFNKAETLNNTMGSFLELELCNKGNVYHKLQLRAELYEEETGDEIEIKEKGVISLLPNAQKKYRISLETVPEGVYEVVVIATCANDEMFGYNYKLHKIE